MVSHIDIIMSLTYRTMMELRKKQTFKDGITDNYKFHSSVFDNGVFHLRHFCGTHNEIQNAFGTIGKDKKAASLTFPCIFNFQSVQESHMSEGINIDYDLAIAAIVDSSWTTEQRNRTVHKYLLEPIYDEFIRQIKKCGWFIIPLTGLKLDRMKVFTTGSSLHEALRTQYGWYIDTIQITNPTLVLKNSICQSDIDTIEKEAGLL